MSLKLVGEVTHYPDSLTTDCTMAHWFLEWHLPNLIRKKDKVPTRVWRPSWMNKRRVA